MMNGSVTPTKHQIVWSGFLKRFSIVLLVILLLPCWIKTAIAAEPYGGYQYKPKDISLRVETTADSATLGAYNFSGGSFTIELWVLLNQPTWNSNGYILSSGTQFDQRGWSIYYSYNYYYCGIGGTGSGRRVSAYSPPDNKWHHWACVYERIGNSSTSIKLYKDGVLQQTNSNPGYYTNSNSEYVYLNKHLHPSGTSTFVGQVDDIRIWKTARTEQQIKDNKDTELSSNPSSLHNYFRLNRRYTSGTSLYGSRHYDGRREGAFWFSDSSDGDALPEVKTETFDSGFYNYSGGYSGQLGFWDNGIHNTTKWIHSSTRRNTNYYALKVPSSLSDYGQARISLEKSVKKGSSISFWYWQDSDYQDRFDFSFSGNSKRSDSGPTNDKWNYVEVAIDKDGNYEFRWQYTKDCCGSSGLDQAFIDTVRLVQHDNCPTMNNPDQADFNNDGWGDVCSDYDGDGVRDDKDNCPSHSNGGQEDMDGDGLGDTCDDDKDADSITNSKDNCPSVKNYEQWDMDGDGIGNACDPDIGGTGFNLAFGKKVTCSSQYNSYFGCDNIVDGSDRDNRNPMGTIANYWLLKRYTSGWAKIDL